MFSTFINILRSGFEMCWLYLVRLVLLLLFDLVILHSGRIWALWHDDDKQEDFTFLLWWYDFVSVYVSDCIVYVGVLMCFAGVFSLENSSKYGKGVEYAALLYYLSLFEESVVRIDILGALSIAGWFF